jgi:hypothetical protein
MLSDQVPFPDSPKFNYSHGRDVKIDEIMTPFLLHVKFITSNTRGMTFRTFVQYVLL